ncbi:MAG: nucleotidyltransferase family protein [Anaerolineae bacterium]|nr:nucleotidyltransferase family protein [Anaerolineae bacterium]
MACTGEFRRRTLEEILEILNAHREELAAPYGVRRMEIFGLCARREAGPESDLDLLVEFEEPPGMFRFLALEHRLSERLGVRVERVTREALQPHIGQNILEEIIRV